MPDQLNTPQPLQGGSSSDPWDTLFAIQKRWKERWTLIVYSFFDDWCARREVNDFRSDAERLKACREFQQFVCGEAVKRVRPPKSGDEAGVFAGLTPNSYGENLRMLVEVDLYDQTSASVIEETLLESIKNLSINWSKTRGREDAHLTTLDPAHSIELSFTDEDAENQPASGALLVYAERWTPSLKKRAGQKYKVNGRELIGMLETGWTKKRIATHFGCTEHTVGNWCVELGKYLAKIVE